MTVKSWWHSLVHGTWTQNRLLSRKWWLVAVGITVAVALDATGRALASDTLGYMRDVTVAYLAVQGALEWGSERRNRRQKEGDE